MASSDFLTAWYRSGVKLVGLMLPAPPWMISRGLMVGADCRCLDSILSVFLLLSVPIDFVKVLRTAYTWTRAAGLISGLISARSRSGRLHGMTQVRSLPMVGR